MDVAVVIPSYNSAATLAEAVESVLAQTHPPREIFIVDDGSTDETRQVAREFGDRVVYLHQENRGISGARNAGIRNSSAEWVAFLDADDVWHPEKLARQVAVLRSDPSIACLGTDIFDWPTAGFPSISDARSTVEKLAWDSLVVRNYVTPSTAIAKRTILERLGLFDERLRACEDHDMWIRIAELASVALLKVPLVGYRDTPGSLGKQVPKMRAAGLQILRKIGERGLWKGKLLLFLRARSYVAYGCGFIYSCAGNQVASLLCVLESVLWYPLPFHRGETRVAFERPKRILILAWRAFSGRSG